ncbi:MAG: nucleotidyltransferase domain-containing protein [Dehalococcoidia bacterium]|jgi:predicted nucleotidyltransferase
MADPVWQLAIEKFSRSIKDRLPTTVKDVRLFGSVARGTNAPESDIDILVLVESDDRMISDIIMDVAVDINLDYDVVISPIIMASSHYANQLFRETAFFHALEQDGVSL